MKRIVFFALILHLQKKKRTEIQATLLFSGVQQKRKEPFGSFVQLSLLKRSRYIRLSFQVSTTTC